MKSTILIFLVLLTAISFSQFRVVGKPEKLVGGEQNIFLNPKWSPDGKFIALTGTNYKGIWILDAEYGTVTQLTDEHAAGFGYEWSNDSRSILTRVAKFEGVKRYNAVKLFDVSEKTAKILSDYNSNMPDMPKWSADNSSIFFYNKGKLEVYSSGKSTLSKNNPDNKEVFLNIDKIITGNIIKQEVTTLEPLKGQQYLNLRLSPDRTKIVFEVYGGNLYIMNSDGSELTELGKGYRASWSPDSKYVVYMVTEDDGHQYTSSDLFIASADGSIKQQLTFSAELEMDPDWSPDGTRIIYTDDKEGAVFSITVTKN